MDQHPTSTQLHAFLHGKLAVSELAPIEAHLELCRACCDQVANLDDDDAFSSGIRNASRSSSTSSPATASPHAVSSVLPMLPGYELLRQLGRGGMGVVYEARHCALNRTVAIKVLRDGAMAGPADQVRFRSEALAIARLQHPNVVQVFETGSRDGVPFVVLEYVAGGTLAQRLNGVPQPPHDAARLIMAIASGVQAAHTAGIIHRDLKPANILLSTPDHVPKISDFGLAKMLDGEESYTLTGTISGTPNYMAPEQARGEATTGPGVDIHALGAVLYELLTGQPPFVGKTYVETLELVRTREPEPPSRLQRNTPRDLDTICMKCLQKEPAARYVSAAALADDLTRYLDGKPIEARPISRMAQTLKWTQRHPAYAGLLLSLVIAIGAGIAGVWYQLVQTESARREAVAESQRAQNRAAELLLDQGILKCEEGQIAEGLEVMKRAFELAPGTDIDLDFAIRTNLSVWPQQLRSSRRLPAFGTAVTSLAMAPNGQTILTGTWGNRFGVDSPGLAQIWNVEDPSQPRITVEHSCSIWCVAFHPDGKSFVSGGVDGTVRRWDTETGKSLGDPLQHNGRAMSVAFSPEGDRLVVGVTLMSDDGRTLIGGEIRSWSWPEGKAIGEPIPTTVAIKCVAWHPTLNQIAIAGFTNLGSTGPRAGAAAVIDMAARKLREPLLTHAEPVRAVTYHPEGWLATGCDDGAVRFWDSDGRRKPGLLRHSMSVNSLAFTCQGTVLIAGCGMQNQTHLRDGPGEVQVWNVASGEKMGSAIRETTTIDCNMVHVAAASPDGKLLAAASENGLAWLTPLTDSGQPLSKAQMPRFMEPQYSPNGQFILACIGSEVTSDGEELPSEFRVLDAATLKQMGSITVLKNKYHRLSPDSNRMFTYPVDWNSDDVSIGLWNIPTGSPIELPALLREPMKWADWNSDGSRIRTVNANRQLQQWDAGSFAPIGDPIAVGTVRQVSRDRCAILAGDESLKVWFPDEGRVVEIPIAREGFEWEFSSAFAESNQVLVTSCRRKATPHRSTIQFWNTRTGTELRSPSNYDDVVTLFETHDARHVLLHAGRGGRNDMHQLIDPRTGETCSAAIFGGSLFWGPAQHPSARFLAVPSALTLDQTRFYGYAGRTIGPAIPHPGRVRSIVFSPDGRFMATSGTDQVIRTWRVPSALHE